MIRLIITTMLVLAVQFILSGQESIEKRISIADAVIEGKVISKQSFWNENHTAIYTKNTIEVYKVFKGRIEQEHLSVITTGGIVENDFQFMPHSHQLSELSEGIFFLEEIENEDYKMAYLEKPQISYKIENDRFNAFDGLRPYSNPADLYAQITATTGSNYVAVSENSLEQNIADWLEENLAIINQTDILIEFTFENITLIGSDKVAFDIMAKSNQEGIKFAASDVYVTYNTDAFGVNVVENEKISASKETVIENEIYSLELTDETTSVVKFLVDAGLEPNQLYSLSQIAEKFLHIEIDIASIVELAAISFDGFLMTNQSFFYDEATGEFVGFDKVAVDEPFFAFLLASISDFEPDNIPAGTGDILTINGSNFGEFDPLVSTVIFVDGDDTSQEMEAGQKDFEWDGVIHWTENQIQLKVPSVRRSGMVESPASTGKIKVRTSDGEITESTETLHIPYSIYNIRQSQFGTALKGTLKGAINDGICFSFSNEVPAWVRTEFQNSLNDWCNATGVNFQIGGTVNNNSLALDGESLITFDGSSGLGAGMVVDASYYSQLCTDGEVGYIGSEIDFVIFSSTTNPSTSDRTQMREMIKHELGHAHMLGHANSGNGANQYLMYETGNVGGVITSTDIMGANLLFTNSNAIVQGDCGVAIGNNNCNEACTTSIEEEFLSDLKLYPNPTFDQLNIFIPRDLVGKVQTIRLFDSLGRLLKKTDIFRSEENYIKLPVEKGIYFIEIGFDDFFVTEKIIKL